jgi:competence protein ComEC
VSALRQDPSQSLPHPAPRLFAFAAAFATGVLLAEATHPAPAVAIAAGTIASVALILAARRPRRAVAVLIAGVLLGSALAGLRVASLDRSALAAGGRGGADAILVGRVLEDPEQRGGDVRMLFGVSSAEIDGRPVRLRERVLLVVRPPVTSIGSGDRVRADVRLSPLVRVGPDVDAAVRASAARLRHEGVAARAYARAAAVERLGPARDALSRVARIGRRAMTRAVSHLPARDAGLLLGVTIGDTSRLDVALEQDFRDTGLSHLTAVSGENLAMFLGAVAFLLRLLRVRRRATIVVLALATVSFIAITRFEPSVLRAGGMAAVGLAGLASGARREALTALGVTCVALLCWDPFLIHVAGFQLSALATIGILVLAPRLTDGVGRGRLGAVAAVTLGAQLAVAPLIALTFHRFTLVALPANVLALPAVAPATVLGFVAATAGAVWPPIGTVLATLARPSLVWMAGVARAFARVPAATVDTPGGVGGVLALALICVLPALAVRFRMPRRAAPILLAVALLATTAAWARALGPPPLHGLVVTAMDVGQGDAWLVRTPRGATMLVDGGPDPSRTLEELRAHHVRRIDLLVLTHPHADHVDGLPVVAASYAVGRGLEAGLAAELPALAQFRATLRERGVALDVVRRGARYAFGEAVVDVLGPGTLIEGTDSDLNNNSVVLRIRFGASCVMMSGEMQEEGQQALLDSGETLHCPIMTVPHHGSKHMLPAYFAAVAPRVALISVGARNTFGHPSAETLAALLQLGVRVLRTDLSGDVSAALGADGSVAVRTAHAERSAA